MDDGLRVTRTLLISATELEWHFSASGGPGGQHANTSNTRAEVVFDVLASASLGPVQRERILSKLGSTVRFAASDTRSQLRNRELAAQRLATALAEALKVERPRRPTKPTSGSKARRLDAKTKRADIKSNRRRPVGDD